MHARYPGTYLNRLRIPYGMGLGLNKISGLVEHVMQHGKEAESP